MVKEGIRLVSTFIVSQGLESPVSRRCTEWPHVCNEGRGGGGGKGGSCPEVTIVNFRFHESQSKKFSSVKFIKVTEKI